jgi:hypothetical protein
MTINTEILPSFRALVLSVKREGGKVLLVKTETIRKLAEQIDFPFPEVRNWKPERLEGSHFAYWGVLIYVDNSIESDHSMGDVTTYLKIINRRNDES